MPPSSSQHHQDFVDFLHSAGLSSENGNYAVTGIPLHKFSATISREMDRGAQIRNEFVTSFGVHVDDIRNLKQCLEPLETGSGRRDNDSLCRILLNIPLIQYDLMVILLDKVVQFQADISEQYYINRLPVVILDHMRYLYSIAKPNKLCDKLDELLSTRISVKDVKSAIFQRIPDIFTNEHGSNLIGNILSDYILNSGTDDDQQELLLSALSALSHLQITDEDVNKVSQYIAEQLMASVQIRYFPNIIQFLLQHLASVKDSKKIINNLRENFNIEELRLFFDDEEQDDDDFLGLGGGLGGPTQRPKDLKEWTPEQAEKVCMDQFFSDLQNKLKTQEIFLKTLSVETEEFKVLDFWILVMLFSLPHLESRAMSLIKKKIQADCISSDLIRSAIHKHASALEPFFGAIATMASVLLCSSSAKHWPIGSCIFEQLFLEFGQQDNELGRKLFEKFVIHLSSSNNNEKDTILNMLHSIAKRTKGNVPNFAPFWQGTLDYLRKLNERQIRLFYSTTTAVSIANGDILTQFVLLLRKQLCNANISYKRIGVIGLGCILRSLSESDTPAEVVDAFMRDLPRVLDTAIDIGCKRAAEQFFLFEEIAGVLSDVKDNLPFAIRDLLLQVLGQVSRKKTLIVPKSELKHQLESVPLGHTLLLDDESISSVVNILSAVDKKDTSATSQLFADVVLQGIILRLDPSDRAFGTRVWFYPVVSVASKDISHKKEKDIACRTLLGVVNWYREMLNVFCTSPQNDQIKYHDAAVRILNELASCESQLSDILSDYTHFRMPKDCDSLVSQVSEKRSRIKKVVKSIYIKSPQKKDKNLGKYRGYIRDLHPDSMSLLSLTQLIGKSSQVDLSAEGWSHLLGDMNHKMEACLASLKKASKTTSVTLTDRMLQTGGTAAQYVSKISALIPRLSEQVTQSIKRHDDFMVDEEDADEQETEVVDKSTFPFRQEIILIFDVLQKIFTYYHKYATPNEKTECKDILTGNLIGDEYSHDDGFARYLQFLDKLKSWCSVKASVSVHWLQLVEMVGENVPETERTTVSEAAKAIMMSGVFDLSKTNISQVMKCAFRYSNNPGLVAQEINKEILAVASGKENSGAYKNINKTTETLYFTSLLEELAVYFKQIDEVEVESEKDYLHILKDIQRLVEIYRDCVTLAKRDKDKTKVHQVAVGKGTKTILKNFNDRCIKTLEMQMNDKTGQNSSERHARIQGIIIVLNHAIRTVHEILLENKAKKSKLLKFNAEIRKEMERFNGLVKKLFSNTDFSVKTKNAQKFGDYEDLMETEEDQEAEDGEDGEEEPDEDEQPEDEEAPSSDDDDQDVSRFIRASQIDDESPDEDMILPSTLVERPKKRQKTTSQMGHSQKHTSYTDDPGAGEESTMERRSPNPPASRGVFRDTESEESSDVEDNSDDSSMGDL
uniref:Uncharacterized protein n=1 Tax=Percolomonas cosmopolitus TaxID=63605 RepID=A0A7S1KLB0_9EUKA|mmetsp:Transcript_10689/g.39957  ORF Transcript_10689/g.39957 Transcript_10689/m.39957 type:complete len:1412 (+) Transcript_10689:194-4429(+)